MSDKKTKMTNNPKSSEDKVALCKKCQPLVEKEKNKENKLYLADMENLRKQKDKEIDLMFKFRNQEFVISMLPILDAIQMAINFKNPTKETKRFLIGVEMAYESFLKVLNSFDVKSIKVNIGDNYDPNFHQTIASEWDENYKENKILKIKQEGFLLHERVIRPTQVIVNQKKKEKNKNK